MKVNRVEQHVISKNHAMWELVDDYCFRSKNLYNQTNYIIRQEFINNGKWLRANELDKMMQNIDCYKELGSQASQKTIQLLDKNWKSYFNAIKDWMTHPEKYFAKPRMPKYKDKTNGRFILMLKNIQCKIKNGYLVFSWTPFREMRIKTNVCKRLIQVRFVPRGKTYMLEIVYEIEIPIAKVETKRIASIDLGVNNLATVSNNVHSNPFVISGRHLKSVNQYYNYMFSKFRSDLEIRHKRKWSNKLQRITNKRNNKVKEYLHKSSKFIVAWCIENQIDTLVIGINKKWKQEVFIGKRNNQNFVSIPFEILINQLKYKCENVGIKFIETDESYTSGTSFLDNEPPTRDYYDKSRRVRRGLFRSNCGSLINADLNGSYQIMKKVFPNVFADGIEDAGLHPVRINFANKEAELHKSSFSEGYDKAS